MISSFFSLLTSNFIYSLDWEWEIISSSFSSFSIATTYSLDLETTVDSSFFLPFIYSYSVTLSNFKAAIIASYLRRIVVCKPSIIASSVITTAFVVIDSIVATLTEFAFAFSEEITQEPVNKNPFSDSILANTNMQLPTKKSIRTNAAIIKGLNEN